MPTPSGIRLETAATYEIRVQERVHNSVLERIGCHGSLVEEFPDGATVTVLTGEFIDQAALVGALNYLFDLGFPLLSVLYLGEPGKSTDSCS